MTDRRKGTTFFWEGFWKLIYGERRNRTPTKEKAMRKIFVFGSNEAGVHGAGAAKYAAVYHGAIYGQGVGLHGESYAIPTKDKNIRTLPLPIIGVYVQQFKEFAAANPDMEFQVTPIGCGLAGYTPADIAPMFEGCTPNCIMPAEFGGPGAPWKG